MPRMTCNLGWPERLVRGGLGVGAGGAGVILGGLVWWGLVLDVIGALLLLSAWTGFCHVRKVVTDLIAKARGAHAE